MPEQMKAALIRWQAHRREIKKPITATGWAALIADCLKCPATMEDAISKSILSGWQGLFPDPSKSTEPNPPRANPRRSRLTGAKSGNSDTVEILAESRSSNSPTTNLETSSAIADFTQTTPNSSPPTWHKPINSRRYEPINAKQPRRGTGSPVLRDAMAGELRHPRSTLNRTGSVLLAATQDNLGSNGRNDPERTQCGFDRSNRPPSR
jgi:hypothetical protein